jgi:hypothetical protein
MRDGLNNVQLASMRRRIVSPEIVEVREGSVPKIRRPRRAIVHQDIEARARELRHQNLTISRASRIAVYEAAGKSIDEAPKYSRRDKIYEERLANTIAQRLRRKPR